MATEFKKLSEVTTLEKVTDTAHVLVEENGEIYRAPKTSVGGAGGVKTAIIRDSEYLNMVAGLQTMGAGAPAVTYECINMTFEEAYTTMANGEPLMVVGMITGEGAMVVPGMITFTGVAMAEEPAITLSLYVPDNSITLFWTVGGLFMP